jgi:formylglycine-generating enzyme required for sulfatase activity
MNKLNSSILFIVVIVMTIQFNFSGTAFGQEAVDLGLPSGLLWSDRNVGAYDDCDCGDYFSYGETDSKSKYTWDTYEYRSGSDEQLSISKYVDNNPYLYKLDAEADPAAVEWGKGWHVPTRGDFLELLDKCDIKIVNDYKGTGVRGLLVYNRKDRSKFIFIAGCGFKKGFERINTSLHKNGHVKLWTATANLKYDANQAFYFVADDGNGGGGHTYGNILEEDFCIGMNMRGVREKTQAEIDKSKAEEQQAKQAEEQKKAELRNSLPNIEMVYVEGGTFKMGATSEQGSDAFPTEKPVHSVTLSSFYIGKTEVTQELWTAVMGSNPSKFNKGGNYPVENISDLVRTFLKKLNDITGKNYRLPTEAEWEYAARGGNMSMGYKYSGSDNLASVAWYSYNDSWDVRGTGYYGTHPVATRNPNELMLYDMSGNVHEWCQDWYGAYDAGEQVNPVGPAGGTTRVYRGGSWYFDEWFCRVSFRNSVSPSYTSYGIGLRLAM